MAKKATFSKISEWIASGGLSTGMYIIEKAVTAVSEKAIGFDAKKFNSYGNLKPATCWFPKSKIQEVQNDFYSDGPDTMYIVPAWLFSAKVDEGFEL